MKARKTTSLASFGPGTIVAALCLALTLLISGQVMAQHGSGSPPDLRFCLLAGMTGTMPPQCRPGHDDGLSPEVEAQLDALRLATMAFYNFDVAQAAGWNFDLSGCVESPMGGMGHHIANLSQLGNGGKLSVFRPEVLLYAPTADGSMEFLGVEYIIPADDWQESDPPELLGQQLHYNPHLDIWALHVWSAKENPDGIFEDWNTDVSCEFAQD